MARNIASPNCWVEKEFLARWADQCRFLRVKFRIWPGQGAPLESRLRPELIQTLKGIDPSYADWMVGLSYEVEEKVMAVPVQPRPRRRK
jgi:small conductance mechanosensitive channel